jgi:uncharacterized protein
MAFGEHYESLLDYIAGLEIIDTHEHVPGRESARNQDQDVLCEYLAHYFSCDLVSAGLPPPELDKARDSKGPLLERWKRVEKYWNLARNTGYGRALDLAARDLYGIEEIGADTIEELDRRFQAARKKGGHYHYVLKEKSRIRVSIIDTWLDCDREFFRSTYRVDQIIMTDHRREMVRWGRAVETPVHCLGDWLQVAARSIDKAISEGAVAIKIPVAYLRSLRFDKVTTSRAEEAFHILFDDNHIADWQMTACPGKDLQDYLTHHICALCEQRQIPIQIHTGLHEGNGNIIRNSDPTLLSNLFCEYTGARFDIFHMGYPYQQTLSALAKNFSNVFIDMCWAHIISPEACVRALVEWLDAVPINKIFAFGGDYAFVDGVYGHQLLARQNVARALALKVGDGCFGLDRAREIAHRIFIDNPAEMFEV